MIKTKIFKFFKIIICLTVRFIPIQKNTVLFTSFYGQYSDNPKYISTQLNKKEKKAKIYWALSDCSVSACPNYVTVLRYGSFKHKLLSQISQVVVDNYLGPRHKDNYIGNSLHVILRRKKQLLISTWHGTPLKRIGMDDLNSIRKQKDKIRLTSDFILSGCHYTSSILSQCVQENGYPITLTGTPRNDILINPPSNLNKIKAKLNLPISAKVILFAPTFRDTIKQSGSSQILTLQIEDLLKILKLRFDNDWVFVFRVHNEVLKETSASKFAFLNIIDGNHDDDMAEYLTCADILITDYSGSMFDFALTGRPCFLFAPDREHYEKQERGFYLNYDSLPFPIAYTNEGLIDNIKNFEEISYKSNVEKFLKDIGNIEDGKASERIANCIIHFLHTGEKKIETVEMPKNYDKNLPNKN